MNLENDDKLLHLPGIFLAVSVSPYLSIRFTSFVPRACDNEITLQLYPFTLNLGNCT